jgi:large conductance mechanosensitive channel
LPGFSLHSDIIRAKRIALSCRQHHASGAIDRSLRKNKEKPMLKGFKEFAMRGNVLDMAVGIIIGAAFGKIVASLVEDLLMPPIGLLLGKVGDFSQFFISLDARHFDTLGDAKRAGAATLNYGSFLNTVINFLIVAFAVYLLVQQVNRWTKKPQPAAAPTTKECPQCAMTIPVAAKRCGHCTSVISG